MEVELEGGVLFTFVGSLVVNVSLTGWGEEYCVLIVGPAVFTLMAWVWRF